MLRLLPILICLVLAAPEVNAKIPLRAGLTQPEDMPTPGKRRGVVFLDVPQVAQGKQPWCVPASVAMGLAYYGEDYSPAQLKALAEGHKHESQRNVWVTSWLDMQKGLKRIGANWKIRHYGNDLAGFHDGMRDIKRSLDRGRPVLIDVDLLTGHTFVIVGYNEAKQVLYFRDPLLRDGRMRILSYRMIYENWHNRAVARTRSAFFTRP